MTVRARVGLGGVVLLVAGVTSACGGDGAPSDASTDDFCDAATSLLTGVMPEDTGTTTPELPSDEDMAQAVRDWGARMEEVGTPEDISDDARRGFEAAVAQAKDIDAADFSLDALEDLGTGAAGASADEESEADAFGDYVSTTCGNPLDGIELPEMPGSTE